MKATEKQLRAYCNKMKKNHNWWCPNSWDADEIAVNMMCALNYPSGDEFNDAYNEIRKMSSGIAIATINAASMRIRETSSIDTARAYAMVIDIITDKF